MVEGVEGVEVPELAVALVDEAGAEVGGRALVVGAWVLAVELVDLAQEVAAVDGTMHSANAATGSTQVRRA